MVVEPNIYVLSHEGKVSMKRRSKKILVIGYIIDIAMFSFCLLRKGDTTMIYLLIGIIIFSTGFLIYKLKKTDKRIDSQKLEIGDDAVIFTELDKPDIIVRISEIKNIDLNKNGIKLKSQNSSKRFLFITRHFKNFDEIESLIEEKVRLSKEAIS